MAEKSQYASPNRAMSPQFKPLHSLPEANIPLTVHWVCNLVWGGRLCSGSTCQVLPMWHLKSDPLYYTWAYQHTVMLPQRKSEAVLTRISPSFSHRSLPAYLPLSPDILPSFQSVHELTPCWPMGRLSICALPLAYSGSLFFDLLFLLHY